MSITDYHSKLRDLWDEYDAIMPCPQCPCPESKKFGEHCDYQRLLQFLMGLNKSYSPHRSQILMMSLIPSLNKAYALLIDQESQRSLTSTSSNSSGMIEGTTMYTHRHNTYNNGAGSSKVSSTKSFSSFGDHNEGYNHSTNSSGGSYKARKNFLQCEHCGCKGHSREQCYKIVGYPSDFKSKKKLLNTWMYVNQVDLHSNPGQENIGCSNKGNNSLGTCPLSGAVFTPAQYQQIIHLLSRSSCENTIAEPSANIAITDDSVDTGASHHITSDLGILNKTRDVPEQGESKVHLPNGKVASVTHIGSTCVLNKQPISNDLYTVLVKGIGKEEHSLYILHEGSSQAPSQLVNCSVNKYVQNVFSTTVKTLRTDNSCEFFNSEVQTLVSELGIAHQSTCVYTPQHNGVAERKNRTILAMARHVLFQEDLFPFKHMQASSDPMFPVLDLISPVDSESVSLPSVTPVDMDSKPVMPFELSPTHIAPLISPTSIPISPVVPVASSRRSGMPTKPPLWLQDFVTQPKAKASFCLYPLASHLTYSHMSPSYSQTLQACSAISEPVTFKEAAVDLA
ncbi:uncharacterized protein [Solanum tuberosum]|uniref:uncharacterized protein n=1 Tax=Solanum tuberosum TaxID=4113 RepID=UPI00073A012A|nr:PREDICTED: uncharacterized protein LOC107058657 [Solanum tuberosum]